MPKFIAAFIAFFTLTCSAYAAPPPVSAYAQLPAVFDAALSPDGQYMAAIMENDGAYIVRVFNIVDGSDKTVRATALPTGAYVKNITWANNDRILVRVGTTQFLDTGTSSGFVKTGFILTMPKSLKKAEILIKPKKARQGNSRIGGDQFGFRQFNDHVIDYLPSDPKNILMVFSEEDANAPNVNRVDVKSGRYKKVRRGSESFQQWFTDRRGQVRVGQGRANTGDSYVMTIRDAIGDIADLESDVPDHAITTRWPKKYAHVFRAIGEGQKLCNVRFADTSIKTWEIPEVFGQVTESQELILNTIAKHRRLKRYGNIPNGNPLPVSEIIRLSGLATVQSDIDYLLRANYLKAKGEGYDLKGAMFCSGLFKRPQWGEPSPTVLTNFHNPRYFLHPSEDRPFTLRECARLQGFANDFLLLGDDDSYSLEDGYRLVGNAVPPPLAEVIANQVAKIFESANLTTV